MGLARIHGSLPAEKCIDLLREKLLKHKLDLDRDIVAIITDGASVMKKVGRLLAIDQQLCFAHGVQLAVIDVIYAKIDLGWQSEDDDISVSDSDLIDEEACFNSEDLLSNSEMTKRNVIINANISPLINKVRKIISMFRKSPTKNDILQNHIRIEFGKDIVLIKDCKTRWSSLLGMLERFYLLKDCTRKTLIDLKNMDTSLDLSHEDIQMLRNLIRALLPIKITVEALCRRDSNLFTADLAINFMLTKLQEADSDISRKLRAALLIRMKERRTDLSGLLQYLHNGRSNISEMDFIAVPSSAKCNSLITNLLQRLDASNHTATLAANSDQSFFPDIVTVGIESNSSPKSDLMEVSLSVAEELDMIIKEGYAPMQPIRFETLTSKVQKEMSLFENGGKRGDYLERIYSYLMTIKPTSVESERAFSSAGQFITRIRSRMNDETLDELCFLKSYLQKYKK